jgi:hypothetical protein
MLNKNFKLKPFLAKKNYPSKKNYYESLDKKFIKKNFLTFSKIIKNLNLVLMHKCDFISKFQGRDIDSFYVNEEIMKKLNHKNSILRLRELGSYRLHLNHNNFNSFLSIDIESPKILTNSADQILIDNFHKSKTCYRTKFKHYDIFSNCYYKLVKYFSLGFVHSYKQLFILKKDINKLDKKNFEKLYELIDKNLYREKYFIHKLIEEKFIKFEKNKKIESFWVQKRILRQKKRKAFAGNINIKNALKIKSFLYSLIFGSYALWSKNHLPMPGIAIVGNDGSGKSLTTNYIRKNFSKMDPLIIDMKASKPYIIYLGKFRLFLKKQRKKKFFIKFKLLFNLVSIIGQLVEFLDKYIKYRIGMAWADSGQGLTIFERYTTDRLRGEFPNKKNKLLPLEQFFPFPDGLIYIDVMPKISMKRKPNDNHTFKELKNKRQNYLSFLNELNEVKKINGSNKLLNNIKLIKNYIFFITIKKRDYVKKFKIFKRILWKKNRNRILYGSLNSRAERDKFL